MTDHDRHSDESSPAEDELTRLADDTLAGPEREELRARVARSPQLQARLRDQERAVALVQSTGEIAAPAALRASVDALTDTPARGRARRPGNRRRIGLGRPRASIALVALAAALVAVVSLALHGQTAPTVAGTARLALAPATRPAPPVSRHNRELLSLRARGASGIPFPSYVGSTGWQASGARHDTLGGRRVTTVFYSSGGARVGYSIVSGAALPAPHGRSVYDRHGVRYVLAYSDGARLITWRRDGHTCVIAGRSVPSRTLRALAAADARA